MSHATFGAMPVALRLAQDRVIAPYAGCGLSRLKFKGISKNSEFAQMQGAEKILVPANLKVTLL